MGNAIFNTPTAADAEALALSGAGATAARDQAVSLGGTANRNNIGGEFAATGDNSVITVNDPQVLSKALEALQQNNESFSATLKNITESANAAGADTLDAALAKLTDLAESKQTAGESGRNNTILYIVLAALAVVGVFVYRKFK